MLSVFICYGGRQGEEIGNKLRAYLRKENFDAFLASPRSSDIPAGLIFNQEIERRLRNAHVMVVICDEGILSSHYALNEIMLAIQLKIPIIPFLKENLNRSQLPAPLQTVWTPVVFKANSPSRKFMQLELEIYRLVIFKLESQGVLLGNQPKMIGIPPQILRNSL